jgi:hypothetical protein
MKVENRSFSKVGCEEHLNFGKVILIIDNKWLMGGV